ncbi:MAG: ParB N-terminal domain-containing protein [Bacteroidales bacterium]|nr:ParB N-terminal domain-containing protein [Bacteroidales bacterium]
MKEIKQSFTQTVKRSEIKLNPYNPKRHTDEEVKLQVKNIKKNGYLGGIVYNIQSGNLIDGHRRVQALDTIHKYDGTPETDYDIKVETVDFDEKTELEQMTYMATQNAKADWNLIADYIDIIDPETVGLTPEEIKAIEDLAAEAAEAQVEDLTGMFVREPEYELKKDEATFDDIEEQRKNKPSQTKEEVKAIKENNTRIANTRNAAVSRHILLEFADEESFTVFCESVGEMPRQNMVLDGMSLLGRLG